MNRQVQYLKPPEFSHVVHLHIPRDSKKQMTNNLKRNTEVRPCNRC